MADDLLSVGIEEEFHVVDLETRRVVPRGAEVLAVLPGEVFTAELQRSSVESRSAVCTSLEAVRTDLLATRRRLVAAAERVGVAVVAAGTVPLANMLDLGTTDDRRFDQMSVDYQSLAREQVICGCHVHVGIADRDLAVAVARRIAPHLSVLLALTTSSPYWQNADTGYASYRTMVWSRWPTAGPFPAVAGADEYDRLIIDLLATGIIADDRMIYYDVRLSEHVPTLELRIADACPRADEVVLLAGLFRALSAAALAAEQAGAPAPDLRPELLRAATWRAARSGLDGELVDLGGPVPVPGPAREVVSRLLQHLRPHLERAGDWDVVSTLAEDLLGHGSSAARQRFALRRRGDLRDVVDLLVAETCGQATSSAAVAPQRAAAVQPARLLDGYPVGPGDEAVAEDGRPRPASAPVLATLDRLGAPVLRVRELARDRYQLEHEVTFAVGGSTRPFPVDLVPRLLSRDEWEHLRRGLEQRAVALELLLRDVYADREAVRAAGIPDEVLDASPGLRSEAALVPEGAVRATVVGIDVVRDSAGHWQVLEDNLRVPSGLAYAVQARRLVGAVLPEVAAPPGTLLPTEATARLADALRAAAPPDAPPHPTVALLSTGPGDSAWWEHRTLAVEMGVPLVLPAQLRLGDDGLYALAAGRLRRVDVVYRRADEELLDHTAGADGRPLGRSLMAGVRDGLLTLANAPGNGVADDKAVYAHVPAFLRTVLGAEPLLDAVPTYLCADPDGRAQVLDRVAELVVKPIDGYGGAGVTIGPAASRRELDAVRRQVRAAPARWIAQELVQLSTSPTLVDGRLEARHVDLRAFVVLRPGADGRPVAEALPAPLTRVAPAGSFVVNSSRGGGAKDTWIVP